MMQRVVIAQTITRDLVVAEIRRENGTVWYALQDAHQGTLAQHETQDAAMAAWRARRGGPVVHAGVYSERRRNIVHLCDRETISPHTAGDDTAVTCPRCRQEMTA